MKLKSAERRAKSALVTDLEIGDRVVVNRGNRIIQTNEKGIIRKINNEIGYVLVEFPSGEHWMHRHNVVYHPTEEAIKKRCAKVRKRWDKHRWNDLNKPYYQEAETKEIEVPRARLPVSVDFGDFYTPF